MAGKYVNKGKMRSLALDGRIKSLKLLENFIDKRIWLVLLCIVNLALGYFVFTSGANIVSRLLWAVLFAVIAVIAELAMVAIAVLAEIIAEMLCDAIIPRPLPQIIEGAEYEAAADEACTESEISEAVYETIKFYQEEHAKREYVPTAKELRHIGYLTIIGIMLHAPENIDTDLFFKHGMAQILSYVPMDGMDANMMIEEYDHYRGIFAEHRKNHMDKDNILDRDVLLGLTILEVLIRDTTEHEWHDAGHSCVAAGIEAAIEMADEKSGAAE